MKRLLILLTLTLQIVLPMVAKDEKMDITTGKGLTQLDAIINSVDNILSQKFSTWTSNMTQTVNDEITNIKNTSAFDPEANITKYQIESLDNIDGNWVVKAKVKIGKSSTFMKQLKRNFSMNGDSNTFNIYVNPLICSELTNENMVFKAGQVLDKKFLNAILHKCRASKEMGMHQQLVDLLEQYQEGMFDYDVKVERSGNNTIKVKVSVNLNKNTYNMAGLVAAFLYSSACGLDCSPTEIRQGAGNLFMPNVEMVFDASDNHFFQSWAIGYKLYNRDAKRLERAISTILTSGIFGFKIVDNLGNEHYMAVSPDGNLKKVGNFNISPEFKEKLPLFCGLGNTKILLHSFKYITDSKSAIKLEFIIPYTQEEYNSLEDVTIQPFNQNLSGIWNKCRTL